MKREITKGILTGTTILYLLYILMTGSGCATQQAQAPPTVIVFCDDRPEDIKARVQKAMYQKPVEQGFDLIDWINKYGGAAALVVLPFIIF